MTEKSEWVVVFSSLNPMEVHLVQNALLQAQISSRIKGAHRSILAGEVPMDDARVELLVNASISNTALQLINDTLRINRPDWACAQCHEMNPGNFEHCWHCGVNRIHKHSADNTASD